MFKKFSSGILITILLVLLAIYGIVRFAGSRDRTFRDKVLEFDQGSVSQILIKNPGKEPVELKLSSGKWIVIDRGNEFAADTNSVKGILKGLSDLPTKRYAGKGKDAWKKYEVTDSAATLVTLKSSGRTIAEVYVGKFSYSMPKEQQQQQQFRQQQGDMTTFVRIGDEEDVYAVDGFLKMNFNRDAASFRNKVLVSVNAGDVNRITAIDGLESKRIEIQQGQWQVNGLPGDSTALKKYRQTLSRLSGAKFIDGESLPLTPDCSLTIEGNNFSPVQLKAFSVADTNIQYIITSSANPGAYFNGKEGGLFRKIWPKVEF
jgi:hypothetical protein